MRICLLADAQSPHTQQLTTQLLRVGHTVHVVTHKPHALPGASVEVFQVPRPGIFNLRGWSGRRSAYFRRLLKSFDVVNIHFLSNWGFSDDLSEWDHCCIVVTPWGSDIVAPPGETPASAALISLRQRMLERAAQVTTCGRNFAETVASYTALNVESIAITPFGVDCAHFRFRPMCGNSTGQPQIGFFKGFRWVYDPLTWIKAMPAVLRHHPAAAFPMIGDGASLDQCRAVALELGVSERIQWRSRCVHALLPDALQTWDVTVMPSIHESFGVAALEAGAMGIPVVATDVCGFRDTVQHGQTGFLLPASNPMALAERVVGLLNDSKTRKAMCREARDWVLNNYNWSKVVLQWTNAYARAIDSASVMI